MKSLTVFSALLAAALCLAAHPNDAAAQAQPEKLEIPKTTGTLSVIMTDAAGMPGEIFGRGNPLTLDINFVLALSATDKYPVSFTLIQEAGGRKSETPVWSGTLTEGFYRLRYPVADYPASSGDVSLKLLMKVRMFTKKYTGESSYQYYTWEGAYRAGKR